MQRIIQKVPSVPSSGFPRSFSSPSAVSLVHHQARTSIEATEIAQKTICVNVYVLSYCRVHEGVNLAAPHGS
jgi:hypothetical protein